MARLLLISPLQSEELYQLGRQEISLSQRPTFADREAREGRLTTPEPVMTLSSDAYCDPETGLEFRIDEALLYRHYGMELISAMVSFNHDAVSSMSRSDVVALEKATTRLMDALCTSSPEMEAEVRWVNRTLVLGPGEREPGEWIQSISAADEWRIDDAVTVAVSWGNNIARVSREGYRFRDLTRAAIFAQYLWCYITDIETRSLTVLQATSEVGAGRQSRLVQDVVDMHYELAMASVFHERLSTEASIRERMLVDRILAAWNYDAVVEKVDARLNRLEHILSARSEILRRRTSRVMEMIVFLITISTVVSLVLAIIQTAFGGAVSVEPGGVVMEATRGVNLDVVLVVSLLACAALVVGVVWLHSVADRGQAGGGRTGLRVPRTKGSN